MNIAEISGYSTNAKDSRSEKSPSAGLSLLICSNGKGTSVGEMLQTELYHSVFRNNTPATTTCISLHVREARGKLLSSGKSQSALPAESRSVRAYPPPPRRSGPAAREYPPPPFCVRQPAHASTHNAHKLAE